MISLASAGSETFYGAVNHDGSYDDVRETNATNPQSVISFPRTTLPECDYSNNFAGKVEMAACVVFPVEWLGVEARWTNARQAQVSWSTASEENVSHFQVERNDGSGWIGVKQAAPAGGASLGASYSVTDQVPDVQQQSVYYRINQVDIDGASHLSPSIELKVQPSVTEVSVSPNPITDSFQMKFVVTDESPLTISVMDVSGRVFEKRALPAQTQSGVAEFDTRSWPPGMYILLINGEKTFVKEVLMKR